ncbi:hypothetical protein SD70_29745 [Gordoniibacillus kamchatkensis]|uniref:Uncharacterized protein n=1 Tax=Gordoniibacillus kamchatkensis TaxID=1590651 RepID=A0ABR5AAC5_9BACL|nr:hypothetical protein [Paenibacillus sp. VKM B-2647]KIL37969.1 hypothetical protein SD70_29745 [Paenibacillus sp. VKM B-2647]
MKINWSEWDEHKQYVKQRKQEIRTQLRDLLESETKELVIPLKEYVDMVHDDEWKCDMLDLLAEALMKIADGDLNPRVVAAEALMNYPGL